MLFFDSTSVWELLGPVKSYTRRRIITFSKDTSILVVLTYCEVKLLQLLVMVRYGSIFESKKVERNAIQVLNVFDTKVNFEKHISMFLLKGTELSGIMY